MFLAKDFIETSEGLVFAVVESGEESGRVLCFLRYISNNLSWQKLNTKEANQLLANNYPEYLYYSHLKQAHCHAVDADKVTKHHQPRKRLKELLATLASDAVENDLLTLCCLLSEAGFDLNEMGVTGSILIGAQKQNSDIDLVFYSRASFNFVRKLIERLIQQGDCNELNDEQWVESFDRRSCDLSYNEYVWHEKRKHNKAMINQRKIDFSFVSNVIQSKTTKQYQKLGSVELKVQIIDDSLAFDYPAAFSIQHPLIHSIVSYTATYTGQARVGEWVEVSGALEEDDEGEKRIVVGSSREAKGEFIKVIKGKHRIALPDFSAVIFDMDGLVLDTEVTYCIAWQHAAAEMGYSFSDEFCLSMSGLHFQDMEKKLLECCGAGFNLKQFSQVSGAYWREYVNQKGIPVKKGFFNLLKILKENHTPFCLATNSGKNNASECLELAGLGDVFLNVITRDDVKQGKPEADVFFAAAKVLGEPISQCLVLEDSKTGLQAAVNAGAPCAFIPSVLPVERDVVNLADCFFIDLNELAQIIS